MANDTNLLSRSIRVHPTFLLGVGVLLVAIGALFGQTVFATIAAAVGLSVLAASVIWIVTAIIVILLGVSRSFEVMDDAE